MPRSGSTSRLRERLRSAEFLSQWLRSPEYDVAEAIVRLRQLRGMSQAELARRIGTKQPAIARIESGEANVTLRTVRALARALGATARVEMMPVESIDPAQSCQQPSTL